MSYLDRAKALVAAIRDAGRYREVPAHQLVDAIDFSSNDYLAMSTNAQVVQAFRHARRVGSGGARLLGGRHREHSLLEEELASWLGRERALLFSSGYHAALGAIPVLARTVNAIYSDELNHASLIDGIRLSHIDREVYSHAALPGRSERKGGALVVSESIFSMDGDCVDVAAMLADLGEDDVLLLDEAHALGVVGFEGAGLAHGLNDRRIVVLGTLSKSLGAHGGFIAGPADFIELLANAARPFIFDTALPPAVALAARVALVIVRRANEARAALQENVGRMRAGLGSLGIASIDTPSPIVPVVLGAEERAMHVSQALLAKKLYAPAIRPPTVPAGTSRLRVSLRSDHLSDHIDLLIRSLGECRIDTL
jgi:8-amino-7-oxononanoate synthase